MKTSNSITLLCFLALTVSQIKAQEFASSAQVPQNNANKNLELAAKNYSLNSFEANLVNGKTYTKWVVTEPTNDCLYLLEYSKDNKHFDVLFSKQGIKSPGSIELLHCFVDNNPVAGTSYYRMRRFSKDGCSVSPVIKVTNGQDSENYTSLR